MTFSKEVIEVFDYIGEKFGIVIDWGSSNVIPYLQELCGKYINYEIVTSIMWIIIGIALILSFIGWKKLGSYCLKRYKEEGRYSDWDSGACISYAIMVICIIIGIIMVLFNISDILKCVYLPELQIYEFISAMSTQ